MTLHRYEILTTKNVATGSEVNTGTENEKFISPKALADSDYGNAEKWTALTKNTDFNDQAPSTSTITMLTDQTANIKAGMALKYKVSGTVYYGICAERTSSLLTISGIALTTGDGDLTELSYCDLPNSTETIVFTIPGAFADNLSFLLNDDLLMKGGYYWNKSNKYLVNVACICTDKDSGTVTTDAKINIENGGESLLSTELEVDTIIKSSAVNINKNFYETFYGDNLEIKLSTLASGTSPNHDALNLTVYLTVVYP